MNLIELYNSLTFPEKANGRTFSAIPIPGHENFKIAIDGDENPVLLLWVINAVKNIALKNFRLKYLQLEQNVECKVLEGNSINFRAFTVITFTSQDSHLREYFLRISETLVKSLSDKPTQQQIIESLNKFVEVFRSLTDPPIKTVHGLWTELFLIDNSCRPQILLDYWHNIPEEKFDFNSGSEKIEVKSNSNFERIHTFSSQQLEPIAGSQVLIASIFIRQSNTGQDTQQLINSITAKVQNNPVLVDKLNNIVGRTLGNTLEQSIKIKFDYSIAKDSVRFYKQENISKIDEVHIPDDVSEVRYRSDLTCAIETDVALLDEKGPLFSSI